MIAAPGKGEIKAEPVFTNEQQGQFMDMAVGITRAMDIEQVLSNSPRDREMLTTAMGVERAVQSESAIAMGDFLAMALETNEGDQLTEGHIALMHQLVMHDPAASMAIESLIKLCNEIKSENPSIEARWHIYMMMVQHTRAVLRITLTTAEDMILYPAANNIGMRTDEPKDRVGQDIARNTQEMLAMQLEMNGDITEARRVATLVRDMLKRRGYLEETAT